MKTLQNFILTKGGTKKAFTGYIHESGAILDKLSVSTGTSRVANMVFDKEAFEDAGINRMRQDGFKTVTTYRECLIPKINSELAQKDGMMATLKKLVDSKPHSFTAFTPYEKYMLKVGENACGYSISIKN